MPSPDQNKQNVLLHTVQDIFNESFNNQYRIIENALYIYQASSDSFVPAQADVSGNLMVTGGGGGGGGGTQYTDGSGTITHPIGTIPVYDKAGTITAVSVANPLPVSASLSLSNYANETGGNLDDIDANTDQMLLNQTNGTQRVGTSAATVNVGQQTVNTTAVQISAGSALPTNGILIGGLSTNGASIFVGGSGVTPTTGAELLPGASLPFTCNLNTLYIISVASTTDKIWWDVA